MGLDRDEVTRYSRNILLDEVGRSGQERLKNARVLVVGAGGLGSPALLYLAAAGVGRITVVEGDRLDLTNLQRQVLYDTASVGQLKAELARERLERLNPHTTLNVIGRRLTPQNGPDVFRDVDVVLDGSDNFPTRFLVNDLCQHRSLPLITGGILRFYGMILGILPGKSPCYRCLFEHPPEPGSVPSCGVAGVLGAVAGLMGSFMAAEAIKFLLGVGTSVFGRMVRIDLLDLEFRTTSIPEAPACSLCRARAEGREVGFDPANSDYTEFECAPPFSLDA